MEENNQNINGENIKREAQETVSQVKESFKNVDMQQETQKAKHFFTGIFKNPASQMDEIAHDGKNNFFKTAIVLVVVAILVGLIHQVASIVIDLFSRGLVFSIASIFTNVLGLVSAVLSPIISIAVMAGIIFLFNKENKKPFLTVVNTVVAVYFPRVIIKVISLLTLIPGAYRIVSPVSSVLNIVSYILLFFGIKSIFDEKDNNKSIKQFVIIELIFSLVAFVLSFLRLSI